MSFARNRTCQEEYRICTSGPSYSILSRKHVEKLVYLIICSNFVSICVTVNQWSSLVIRYIIHPRWIVQSINGTEKRKFHMSYVGMLNSLIRQVESKRSCYFFLFRFWERRGNRYKLIIKNEADLIQMPSQRPHQMK